MTLIPKKKMIVESHFGRDQRSVTQSEVEGRETLHTINSSPHRIKFQDSARNDNSKK